MEDVKLLMQAEDLYVAPVITWWNKRNLWQKRELPRDLLVKFDGSRFYHVMAGEDEREGGALMYFNLKQPLPITEATCCNVSGRRAMAPFSKNATRKK